MGKHHGGLCKKRDRKKAQEISNNIQKIQYSICNAEKQVALHKLEKKFQTKLQEKEKQLVGEGIGERERESDCKEAQPNIANNDSITCESIILFTYTVPQYHPKRGLKIANNALMTRYKQEAWLYDIQLIKDKDEK